jgi:hypothetical protein
MQCLVCGHAMQVVKVEPHHRIDMPGFELRTYQCVGCGDVEKRPYFDGERARRPSTPVVPEAQANAPDIAAVDSQVPEAGAAPEPVGRMKAIFGGLARLRGRSADQ